MSTTLKHSVLAWALIVTQLAFCVIGQGRVVVCHDEGGPSHIEFVHGDQSSSVSQDNCGQAPLSQDGVAQSICTGSPCVDETISFTSTINTRRMKVIDSLTDVFPNAPPLPITLVHPLDSVKLFGQGTNFETALCLIELQCSIRTTVLVI